MADLTFDDALQALPTIRLFNGQYLGDLFPEIIAALSAPVPSGWKLVPIEPDHLMFRSGDALRQKNWDANNIYRAMLKAAPQCPDLMTRISTQFAAPAPASLDDGGENGD